MGKKKTSTSGRKRGGRAGRNGELAGVAAWGCAEHRDCFIQKAVSGLAIGIILIDPTEVVVWLNRAAEQLLDIPAAKCVGRKFKNLMLDPQLLTFWHETMCRNGNCMGDVSIQWPHKVELKINATQCLSQDGTEIGRALLFCDVTSDRNVQIELTKEMANRLLSMEPSREEAASVATLTAQEQRVMRLVGRGLANEDIAEKLCVAPSTIRSHLKNIYKKLDLGSRPQAVNYAVRMGLT